MPGMIFHELAIERDSADCSQNKENKARNFQPELVQNSAEGTQCDLARFEHGAHGTVAARMLSGHLCENPQFAG